MSRLDKKRFWYSKFPDIPRYPKICMNMPQAKMMSPLVVGALIVFVLVYLFVLNAYFPLPRAEDLFASQREIIASTLPLKHRWTFNSGSTIVFPPFVTSSGVVVRTYHSLEKVDASNGKKVWEVSTGAVKLINVYLAAQGEKIIFSSFNDTRLNVISASTGRTYWSTEISGLPNSISALVTTDSTVFIGIGRAAPPLRGYSLANGEPNWTPIPDLPGGVTPSPLVILNNILYVFQGSSLYLFDTASGKILQSLPGFVRDGTSIKVRGNIVYMWNKQALIAKDIRTSEVLWRYNHPPLFYALADDRIIVYSDCCTLATLAVSTGKVIWQQELRRGVVAQMTILNNIAYVMGDDGSITAFHMDTGEEIGRLETSPRQVNYFNKQVGMTTDGTCLYAAFGDRQLFAFC